MFQDKCGWTDKKTDRDEKEKIESDKYKKQNMKRHKLEIQKTIYSPIKVCKRRVY